MPHTRPRGRFLGGWLVLPRFRDAVLYGALLGFVFPLLIMALSLVGISLPETTLFLLWPAWAVARSMGTMWSVVCNIPLYVTAFAFLWLIISVSSALYDDLTNR